MGTDSTRVHSLGTPRRRDRREVRRDSAGNRGLMISSSPQYIPNDNNIKPREASPVLERRVTRPSSWQQAAASHDGKLADAQIGAPVRHEAVHLDRAARGAATL